MLENRIRKSLSDLTFRGMKANADFHSFLSLPVISTGRSFAYYRRVFFRNRSKRTVLSELRRKRIVDIGCGLTPYLSDSMFQVCRQEGIEFYGVDPKLADGFRFNLFDVAGIRAVGGRGRINPRAPGLEKALATSADDLPFADNSLDLILSSFLLYAWIQDEETLENIYREFQRVLKPGGEVRIYPVPDLDPSRIRHSGLREIMSRFEIRQRFSASLLNPGQYPPAYMMTLRKT